MEDIVDCAKLGGKRHCAISVPRMHISFFLKIILIVMAVIFGSSSSRSSCEDYFQVTDACGHDDGGKYILNVTSHWNASPRTFAGLEVDGEDVARSQDHQYHTNVLMLLISCLKRSGKGRGTF